DTAVLAASIWINAGGKTNVRAVVVINDGSCLILQKQRLRRWIFRLVPIRCVIGQRFESIGRIARSSPTSSFFGTHLFTFGLSFQLRPIGLALFLLRPRPIGLARFLLRLRPIGLARFLLRLRPIGLALRCGLLELAFGRSPPSSRI